MIRWVLGLILACFPFWSSLNPETLSFWYYPPQLCYSVWSTSNAPTLGYHWHYCNSDKWKETNQVQIQFCNRLGGRDIRTKFSNQDAAPIQLEQYFEFDLMSSPTRENILYISTRFLLSLVRKLEIQKLYFHVKKYSLHRAHCDLCV